MSETQTTTWNDIAVLKDILEKSIKPLLHKSTLCGPFTNAMQPFKPVTYDTRHRIKMFLKKESRIYFTFQRNIPFSLNEKTLIEQIVLKLREFNLTSSMSLFIEETIEKVLSRMISEEHANLLFHLIQVYKKWAGNVIEGKKQTHTIGVYLNKQKKTGSNFFNLKDDALVRTIASTAGNLLALDKHGNILGIESLMTGPNLHRQTQTIFAPISAAETAIWTNATHKVAMSVTDRGDILIFKDKRLLFVFAHSKWRYISHGMIMDQIFTEQTGKAELEARKAVYLTLLDMAFERNTISIGIFNEPERKHRRLRGIHSSHLRNSWSLVGRANLLNTLVNERPFQEIPRKTRVELCTFHGSVILNQSGDVFALGTPLKKSALPEKTAPLRKVDKTETDIGIKITEEGMVEIYKDKDIPLAFA